MSINFSSDAASLKSEEKVGGIASPTAGNSTGSDNSAGVTPGPESTGVSQPVTPIMPERKPVEHSRDEPAAQGSLRAAIESRPERRAPIDHVWRAVWITE